MKGWIKVLSVPLITALVLTGCGSGASTKKADRGEKKTSLQKSGNDMVLRVSGAEEDTELLKQVMENFKKDNPDCPYTLEQVTISESNARDTILGDINNAPDVFTFADDQLRSMIASGILGEVTDESALSENVKAAVEAATVSGKTYAYPLTGKGSFQEQKGHHGYVQWMVSLCLLWEYRIEAAACRGWNYQCLRLEFQEEQDHRNGCGQGYGCRWKKCRF